MHLLNKNNRTALLLVFLGLCCSLAMPEVRASALNPEQKKEVESIIESYLITHPEIIQKAIQKLEEKQKLAEEEQRNAGLKNQSSAIFHDKGDFAIGNLKGDVTAVEFFDYNCGWCKKSFSQLQTTLATDKNLRIILKEFPIFGKDSVYAAQAVLAAKNQNKYWELHQALFQHEGKVTPEVVDAAAQKLGLDSALLKKDMQGDEVRNTLMRNQQLAEKLSINGTPAFVLGDQFIPGYISSEDILAIAADVRKRGACKNC